MTDKISKLRNVLRQNKLDCLLVSSLPNIIYLTGFSNFSKEEREAFLLITKDKHYIFTDRRYTEAVLAQVKNFKLIETSAKLPLLSTVEQLMKKHKINSLGIEEDTITVSEYKKLSACLNVLKHLNINTFRLIKSNEEIDAIEKACELGDKTFEFILNKLKPDVSEKEIAFELEFFIKKYGADISFLPIVAFGAHSSIPHHQPTNQKLITNTIVLLDFGVKLNNYCSDMTRTVFMGKATDEQKRMYQTVLEAQKKSLDSLYAKLNTKLKPVKASEVDQAAREFIVSQGYPSIPHSVGHGTGIEVHELPRLGPNSKDILETGMVFSIEPGIYIPNFGGIRIEDLVVLEKSGPRLLTKSSKELIEL